jgi:hypothetical protein
MEQCCQIFWPADDEWYLCTVQGFNASTNKTTVVYDEDGMTEELDMATEVYRLHGVAEISVPTRTYLQVRVHANWHVTRPAFL